MKIKQQLLLVSLLILSLPWAGYQFIYEIKAALRYGQSQALQATTQAIAASLSENEQLLYPDTRRLLALSQETIPSNAIYANYTKSLQVIDGYFDQDNVKLEAANDVSTKNFSLEYQLLQDKDNYYLLVVVNDKHINYAAPNPATLSSGDRLVLLAETNGRLKKYFFRASTPGAVYAQFIDGQNIKQDNALFGFWQETNNGYTIELQLPKALIANRLGFYLEKQGATSNGLYVGNINKNSTHAPWVVGPLQQLQDKIAIFNRSGLKLKVLDLDGWQLAETLKTSSQNNPPDKKTFWLIEKLYRYLLTDKAEPLFRDPIISGKIVRPEIKKASYGETQSQWYRMNYQASLSLLSTATPIYANNKVIGVVVAEETSDQFLALTNSAFNRLIYLSFLSVLITGLGLLAYASWLGYRIQKLSKAAKNIIGRDGQIINKFPKSRAQDEIGELTRSYAELVKRLQEYTDYLRTLSKKLSHELRTPLAIVHSSLDNLESEAINQNLKTYHLRAKEGANRLSRIITAMSEATRVEESIDNSDFSQFSPIKLIDELCLAYSDTYDKQNISFINDCRQDIKIYGNPDLIVQMLDKLVDNASDFCPNHGSIVLAIRSTDNEIIISISNDGPLLPESMKSQLFESMVSIRDNRSERTHLGLGLHIVKLIVKAHHGKIYAENRPDGSGVVFNIHLPVSIHT